MSRQFAGKRMPPQSLPGYIPTLAEIEAGCLAIQQGEAVGLKNNRAWTDADYYYRAGTEPPRGEVPVIADPPLPRPRSQSAA